jgi:DICT domain-containing protein
MGAVMDDSLLTIGQVADRTGLSEPTLRAWERRFGFPAPVRGPGGRRRYPAEQIDQLWRIKSSRKAGLSLEAAVERATSSSPSGHTTVFGSLAEHPGVRPVQLRKKDLAAVVRGLEDEMIASGTRPLVFASFQDARFYGHVERRYREVARVAEMVVVRGEFASVRLVGGVLEVPLDPTDPSSREWAFVSYAPGFAVALAAWEVIEQSPASDDERRFELVWSADAAAVRDAARTAVDLAARAEPEVATRAAPLLADEPPPGSEELRRLTGIANRVLAYLVSPEGTRD